MDTFFQAGQRRTYQEMRQKPVPRDTFFSLKSDPQAMRPTSVATEFVDTDWDEEIVSEGENSPRVSLQSSGQPSITTLSSYDEVPTPRSSRGRQAYLDQSPSKQVEGPRGPHLFRNSTDPSLTDVVLSLSPVTPKGPRTIEELLVQSKRRSSPFQYSREELDRSKLVSWTPEMVAQSMLNAGIELGLADRFIENDINGPILITLKFEDLRELDIPSFGIRTKIWHQIQALRDGEPEEARPPTPIDDAPSREARRDNRRRESTSHGRQSSRRRQRRKPSGEDIITPMESVSIIGIEQVIPKPHACSKGENCSKWKKQQRLLDQFKAANPNVEIRPGGTVMIMGDAGNPETAKAINPNEALRPVSDAVPSVVASSDVLGPGGIPALQYLQEATLRNLEMRDAQENVRQFLNFQQHQSNDVPPTPPFEVTPSTRSSHHGLRRLPKLAIPDGTQTPRISPLRASTVPQATQQAQPAGTEQFQPYYMNKADPISPDLETPKNPYRFGTPFSELDVPLTAVPIGPVARDFSQSVPPDMNYRAYPSASLNPVNPTPRAQSRASARRPSFPVLPALDENKPVRVPSTLPPPRASVRPQQPQQAPMQAPPRFNYPWSPGERSKFEQAIPPMPAVHGAAPPATINGVTQQGPMKKRKTRMLRHEWQDGYFTLKGTRLNMHKDLHQIDRTLEYIDIDDYAIACSSLASTSKLSAAFKAVSISHNRDKSDPVAAFSFQLIPQDKNGGNVGARLRKRESAVPSLYGGGSASAEGVNGTGKTHHFAVKGRDERIDWMRELMLAKALKQKGDGFEISVNGNMI